MIETKVTVNDNNSDISLSNEYENEHSDDLKDVDVSDDVADKALYLISDDKSKSLTPDSSKGDRMNDGNMDNMDGYDYDSEDSEESESESEFSTEDDEESSDENDIDQSNNSIMEERWKQLEKYGVSVEGPLYPHHMTTPINLSANSSNAAAGADYPFGGALPDDPYLMGMGAGSALNMSMRHLSQMQKPPSKPSLDSEPYPMLPGQKMPPPQPQCRLPPPPNMHLNNFDYQKHQRHVLGGPQPFGDLRSQFHLNMMMNAQTNGPGAEPNHLQMGPMGHAQMHHHQDFRCNYCNKCYTNQSSLRSHLKKHMNIEEKKFKCDKCSYSSQYQKNLLKHIHINHAEISADDQCRCDVCDRFFASEFLLKDHLKMHTSDNTYECEKCGKKLKTKLKLRYHADVHNPEKPYICDIDGCDRAFRTPKYLKNHKDEFHKLQPKKHFCPVESCKLVFQRKSHLKRHMAIHDTEKNYHCHWPDCNRSFRTQETLNVHLIRHTGEKPFKCELCEYSCRQKASLNYHCRNAHAKDCDKLLSMIAASHPLDSKPVGSRPVGRPPKNRSDNINRKSTTKFELSHDENDSRLESKIESDVNGIINNLNKDPSIIDIFKKPAPVDEDDLLRKEIFLIADDVLNNLPRDYGDVEEFTLEELCAIELSIKSKRGRKRKVLKELDALLAQSMNELNNDYIDDDDNDDGEDDSNSYKEDEIESQSPIVMKKSQYTPSLMHSVPNDHHTSTNNNIRSLATFSDIHEDDIRHEIIRNPTNESAALESSQCASLNFNSHSMKAVKPRLNSFASLAATSSNHGVSSFDANYILNNDHSCVSEEQSVSQSNSPTSGHVKVESDVIDETNGNMDSRSSSVQLSAAQPANLSCHKRNNIRSPSTTNEFVTIDSNDRKDITDFDLKSLDDNTIQGFHNLPKQLENPLSALNSLENLKMNKDLLDQVLEDLKIMQNDEDQRQKTFLSPTSATTINNTFRNISELNSQRQSCISQSLKVSTNECQTQPKSLDSSLWSDSGYSSGHDSSTVHKDSVSINGINQSKLNPDKSRLPTSPASNAAAALIEKTAAAAEMAALSASAALLNSDLYNYHQNMGSNRTSGYSSYQGSGSGLANELTTMSNIASSMYKNGLEDHIRSLTALGSKYMEGNGYQGNRGEPISGSDVNSMAAFSNLWSSATASANDYLSISNSNGPGSSLNPFDPSNDILEKDYDSKKLRNGIGDYCNLAQSPSVVAAADLYSQMAASANYDKYSGLYGCRDNFYGNPNNRSLSDGPFPISNNHYADRSYLPSSHPFYPQSDQYSSRYPPSAAAAADYLSMGRQFSSGGSSGNPFSIGSDPYRNSMLHSMSPFNRYPF